MESGAAADQGTRARLVAAGTRFYDRYAKVLWTIHSLWALTTGAAVLVLAHNRYGFIPWVVLFLVLTWASTLLFSRLASQGTSLALRFAQGFVSYLTRIMYQETLFFLIPFYFYSTTFPSLNSLFVIALAGLAALSCFDLLFDRLLRERRAFALGFFGVVSFSALQFFLPWILHVRVIYGAYLAAALAVLAAVPLAYSFREMLRPRRLAATLLALMVAVLLVRLLQPALPPVPLRLTGVRFSGQIDARTLDAPRQFTSRMPAAEVAGGRMFAVATIFAPGNLPASLVLRFVHDGEVLRTTRAVEALAHSRGFRVYAMLRPPAGGFEPGRYSLEVRTVSGQLVGRRTVELVAGPVPPV